MENSEFLDVLLSNNVRELKHYLKISNILYKKTKTNIIFKISIDEYPMEWNISYKKNSFLNAICDCKFSRESYFEIKRLLSFYFNFLYKNPITSIEYFEYKPNNNITLSIDNGETMKMTIDYFYRDIPKRKVSLPKILGDFKMIIFALIGAGISASEYILYSKLNLQWLNILMAVFSVIFMVASCYILSRISECTVKKSFLYSIVLPTIYFAAVFIFLIILNTKNMPDVPVRMITCMYWSFYAMPAFVIVGLIAILFFIGVSYA